MPCRYCRISTTSSFSVSATTFTQGGYSLIQYSGITVPFGSSTRSTRTVYQGFFATYSRVRTFQGPGSSSKWSGICLADDATRALENSPHHRCGQFPGVGVLAARVVAAEQQRQPGAELRLAAVPERRARAGADAVRVGDVSQVGVVADLAQRHHDAQAGEGGDLGRQGAAAADDLAGGRLVVGWRAADGREGVGVAQREPVGGVLRGGDVGEPRRVKRGHEEVARAVAGEDPSGPVGAVGGRGQADQQQAGVRIAEPGHWAAPVGVVAVGSLLLARDPLAVPPQPRAVLAVGDRLANLVERFELVDGAGLCPAESFAGGYGIPFTVPDQWGIPPRARRACRRPWR